jgi:hypothetical protein
MTHRANSARMTKDIRVNNLYVSTQRAHTLGNLEHSSTRKTVIYAALMVFLGL